MQVQLRSNPRVLTLNTTAQLGRGGEACIYQFVADPAWAAKIYHHPSFDHYGKLKAMLANPPIDPMAVQHHHAIAWPADLLFSSGPNPKFLGFVMPRVHGMHPIMDFYHRKTRKKKCPLFHYGYLLRTARNLTTAVQALHERGYVLGDINESNILVADTALVTLVDTDSFQVREDERVHRCAVGKAEFTPPELQGKDFRGIDRTSAHDCFGLAVLIFQLLMEGVHPFAGKPHKPDDSPLETRIMNGHFPHGSKKVPYSPKPLAPPFSMLAPELRALFVQCFERGHMEPGARPDTQAWQQALAAAEAALIACTANRQHFYGNHLAACPWCQLTRELDGHDPFPSPAAIGRGEHLARIEPARTPLVSPVRTAARPVGRPAPRPGFPPPNYLRRPPLRLGPRRATLPSRWRRQVVGITIGLAIVVLAIGLLMLLGVIGPFGEPTSISPALADRMLAPSSEGPSSYLGPQSSSPYQSDISYSPRKDIVIVDQPDTPGSPRRTITLADITTPTFKQVLYSYTTFRESKPEVLFAYDDKSLVVNRRGDERGETVLFTRRGELGSNPLKFDPDVKPGASRSALGEDAWSFYARSYRRTPIIPLGNAYCLAVAWHAGPGDAGHAGSEEVVIRIGIGPRVRSPDSTPWFCRYNVKTGELTAISPLDGFTKINKPVYQDLREAGVSQEAYDFIHDLLLRENSHELPLILDSYAYYVDSADGKPQRTRTEIEEDYKNEFERWPRSRRDLISTVALKMEENGEWQASFWARCRKESGREWYEAEENHSYRFKAKAGKFQISEQVRHIEREEHGQLILPPPFP